MSAVEKLSEVLEQLERVQERWKAPSEHDEAYAGKAIAYDFVKEGGVIVMSMFGNPGKLEWARYLDFCVYHKPRLKAVVVYGVSGAPDSLQRKALHERMGKPP